MPVNCQQMGCLGKCKSGTPLWRCTAGFLGKPVHEPQSPGMRTVGVRHPKTPGKRGVNIFNERIWYQSSGYSRETDKSDKLLTCGLSEEAAAKVIAGRLERPENALCTAKVDTKFKYASPKSSIKPFTKVRFRRRADTAHWRDLERGRFAHL